MAIERRPDQSASQDTGKKAGFKNDVTDAQRKPEAHEVRRGRVVPTVVDTFLEANKRFLTQSEATPGRSEQNQGIAVITCMDRRNTAFLNTSGLDGAILWRTAGATVSDSEMDKPDSGFNQFLAELKAKDIKSIILVPHTECGIHVSQDKAAGGYYGFFHDLEGNSARVSHHIREQTGISVATIVLDVQNGELRSIDVPDTMKELTNKIKEHRESQDLQSDFQNLKPNKKVLVVSGEQGALFEKAAGIEHERGAIYQVQVTDQVMAGFTNTNVDEVLTNDALRSISAAGHALGVERVVMVYSANSEAYQDPEKAKRVTEYLARHERIPDTVKIDVMGIDETGKLSALHRDKRK